MARITRSTQNTARISRGKPRTEQGSKARLASIAEAIAEATQKAPDVDATSLSPSGSSLTHDARLAAGDLEQEGGKLQPNIAVLLGALHLILHPTVDLLVYS